MTDEAARWRRVEQLCAAALERPSVQRPAFLNDACGADEALRREVEQLLAQESQAAAFLQGSVAAVAAEVMSPAPRSLTGQRLNALEIAELIGAGGMGEVYRARDTKLKRDVAVKVLPAAFAADTDRVARFRREAQLLASLNDPHIGAIYGFEDTGDIHGLVLELVEGPTLADCIAQGAIPVQQALSTIRQVAEALIAAHKQGIVHRDLKPANVKVRPDGVVKVLDFGLAKVGDWAYSEIRGSQVTPITRPGIILGTPAYMSPEQIRGQATDARTDVWALGALLYEMITRRPAFSGTTTSDTIAAVLTKEPVWRDLPASVGAPVKKLIRHCLQKDPLERLESVALAKQQIDMALIGVRSRARLASRNTGVSVQNRVTKQNTASSGGTTNYSPLSFEPGGNLRPVWSPDGKAVAFAAAQSQREPYQVYVRYLDAQSSVALTRMPLDALPVSWTARGQILFETQSSPAGLWSVSQTGGHAEPALLMNDVPWHASVDGAAVAHYDQQSERAGLWISDPAGAPYTRYTPAPFDGGVAFRV